MTSCARLWQWHFNVELYIARALAIIDKAEDTHRARSCSGCAGSRLGRQWAPSARREPLGPVRTASHAHSLRRPRRLALHHTRAASKLEEGSSDGTPVLLSMLRDSWGMSLKPFRPMNAT